MFQKMLIFTLNLGKSIIIVSDEASETEEIIIRRM